MTTETPRLDIMARGEERRTVVRNRPAATAELYLSMRRKQLEQTHQQAMEEFAQTTGGAYTSVPELARSYFARWQQRYDDTMKTYQAQRQAIEGDRLMDSLRRAQALQSLRPPMYPAWDEERERGFINTYGNPRDNVADWNAQLNWLTLEEVEALNGDSTVMYQRTSWELYVPYLLAHPETDRSAAACAPIAISADGVPVSGHVAVRTRDAFAPPVPEGALDSDYYQAMSKVARNVCPHCYIYFPSGFKAHEMSCAKKNGVVSIHADEVAASGQLGTEPYREGQDDAPQS